jgi:choline-sulfatase
MSNPDTPPNILLIMSDEHAPMYSSTYGHPLVQTPNMDELAAQSVTFENAYCNSPLCCPSRMSFMTGRYVHRIGTWDNASPLASDSVTWAHLLGAVGYDVVLSGKQHFCGPDQLHGFRAQLARDLHAELWTRDGVLCGTPDWTQGTPAAPRPWGGVQQAGPGTTLEIEVDDLVEEQALAYLRDPARKTQPWALNVSFIAPHFPLVVPQRFWELYPLDTIDMPEIPPGHLENQHPVHQRMRRMFGCLDFPEELVRRARAGYYGLITYLDEKVGRLLDVLKETGQYENTVVIHCSDHGEMNGEHGMWRKSSFYEASVRVPLQISWPGHLPAGRRVNGVVSLVDLIATLADITDATHIAPLDGDSLLPLMRGTAADWKNEAFSEYLAHGVAKPTAMLRRGHYKLHYSLGDPPQLYDLAQDPDEFHDLAQAPAYQSVVKELQTRLLSRWDAATIEEQVLQSQKERRLIEQAYRASVSHEAK